MPPEIDASVTATTPPATIAVETVTPPPAVTTPLTLEAEPTWLPSRLAREKNAMLKDLGANSIEEAKAAIALANKQREDAKSHELRASELQTQLDASKKVQIELETSLKTFATSKLASLTEEQRKAVLDVAGEDPARQVKIMDALAPTWVKPAAVAALAAPVKVVANTAPPGEQPSGVVSPPTTKKAEYERLKTVNPILADRFLIVNQAEIFTEE